MKADYAEIIFSAFPLNFSRVEVFVLNGRLLHRRRVKTISRRVYARTMKTQGQLKEELNKLESLSFPLHLPALKRSTA